MSSERETSYARYDRDSEIMDDDGVYNYVTEIMRSTASDLSKQMIHFQALQQPGPDDSPAKMEARRQFKQFFDMKRKFSEVPADVKDVKYKLVPIAPENESRVENFIDRVVETVVATFSKIRTTSQTQQEVDPNSPDMIQLKTNVKRFLRMQVPAHVENETTRTLAIKIKDTSDDGGVSVEDKLFPITSERDAREDLSEEEELMENVVAGSEVEEPAVPADEKDVKENETTVVIAKVPANDQVPTTTEEDEVLCSPTEEDSLPKGSTDCDGQTPLHMDEAEDNLQLVLNSSALCGIIRIFFQCLNDRQWREVSEGIYNHDVKELLVKMCTDVLEVMSLSIINTIHNREQETGANIFKWPLSHVQLKKLFQCDLQASFKSSFRSALQDIIGFDKPVMISPLFEEAMMEDVIGEVNSALSARSHVPSRKKLSSAAASSSPRRSKPKATEKTLRGAIKTMQSFLTGRVNAIKAKIFGNAATGTKPEPAESKVSPSEKVLKKWRTDKVASADIPMTEEEKCTSCCPGRLVCTGAGAVSPKEDVRPHLELEGSKSKDISDHPDLDEPCVSSSPKTSKPKATEKALKGAIKGASVEDKLSPITAERDAQENLSEEEKLMEKVDAESEVEEPTFTEADSSPDTTAVIISQKNDNMTGKTKPLDAVERHGTDSLWRKEKTMMTETLAIKKKDTSDDGGASVEDKLFPITSERDAREDLSEEEELMENVVAGSEVEEPAVPADEKDVKENETTVIIAKVPANDQVPTTTEEDEVLCSPTEEDSLPKGSTDCDGQTPLHMDEAEDNLQLVLNSSALCDIIRIFFQCLNDRQWREVSEGIYNHDVKKLLVKMCTDVLEVMSLSVINTIHNREQETGANIFKWPLSHVQLKKLFQCDLQASFKSSFQSALQNIVGFDKPVMISPLFEKAMMEDVIGEVNSALSARSNVPSRKKLSSAAASSIPRKSKPKATEKTLRGAIKTMQSFLTGRVNAIKAKIFGNATTGTKPVPAESKVSLSERVLKKWRKNKAASADIPMTEEEKCISCCPGCLLFTGAGAVSPKEDVRPHLELEGSKSKDTSNHPDLDEPYVCSSPKTSKPKATEKVLKGAIKSMQCFLTGRVDDIKAKIFGNAATGTKPEPAQSKVSLSERVLKKWRTDKVASADIPTTVEEKCTSCCPGRLLFTGAGAVSPKEDVRPHLESEGSKSKDTSDHPDLDEPDIWTKHDHITSVNTRLASKTISQSHRMRTENSDIASFAERVERRGLTREQRRQRQTPNDC